MVPRVRVRVRVRVRDRVRVRLRDRVRDRVGVGVGVWFRGRVTVLLHLGPAAQLEARGKHPRLVDLVRVRVRLRVWV